MSESYRISEQDRKLQVVQLDLLEKFKEICRKYDLKYSATAGTLLGAARHKGFIPWDDDIDLALMWPDYQKLLEVAPRECQYPYFFQSYLTDDAGAAAGCRLRRSDTTGFTKWEHDNRIPGSNHGIFIDIFPLFYVPDDEETRQIQKKRVLHFWDVTRGQIAAMQVKYGLPPTERYREFIPLYEQEVLRYGDRGIKEQYLKACAMIDHPTRTIGATASKCHQQNLMWDAEWYADYVELPFEDTIITCPIAYEKVLERHYGNWRVPVMNGAIHEMYLVDTERPYAEYYREL